MNRGIPFHDNIQCYFESRPYKYHRQFLSDIEFLKTIKRKFGFCTCYEFAWIHNHPSYENTELTEMEFCEIACNAGYLYNERKTPYEYTLGTNEGMVFFDRNVADIMAEYMPETYQKLFRYTKTPREGRMYWTLLGYLYPEQPIRKEPHFTKCFNEAFDEVFAQIKPYEPISLTEAIDKLPKNTSAGFISIRRIGKRRKKEVFLEEIIQDYKNMNNSIQHNQPFSNCFMFAMRGHLSEKTKNKTRPIWMQSAEVVLAETRFAEGMYQQLMSNDYFLKRVIHGEGALRKLRRYLSANSDFEFTNTDISGWDAFRSVEFHKKFFQRIRSKINMTYQDSKLYDYVHFNSNIYARVCFPSGYTYATNGGLKTGSRWTLLQNTLLNMILTLTALKMMGLEQQVDYVETSWLGDDFSIKTRRPFDLVRFGSILMKYFSLRVKPEKCFVASPNEDRKFLGYEIRGGLLYKELSELWAGSLYTEYYFKLDYSSIAKSFTRLFSYLMLGGYNNDEYVNFFYLFLGKYGNWLDSVEYIFDDRKDRISRVLKDIFNINISKFNSDTFKNMKLYLTKYILLYDYDFITIKELV